MATTKPTLPPRLSLKERDRRYKLIRKQMAVEGLDVLICPGNHRRWSQMMADSVYVTTIGGFSTENLVIFPLKGQVTSFVFTYADFWKESQNWVKDVRGGGNKWSDNCEFDPEAQRAGNQEGPDWAFRPIRLCPGA